MTELQLLFSSWYLSFDSDCGILCHAQLVSLLPIAYKSSVAFRFSTCLERPLPLQDSFKILSRLYGFVFHIKTCDPFGSRGAHTTQLLRRAARLAPAPGAWMPGSQHCTAFIPQR